jgi:Protein of unknown function (DUF3604).
MKKLLLTTAALLALNVGTANAQETNLYWGDTHLHTKVSGDAYIMGERSLTPDDAYRFAKGETVANALTKKDIKIGTPLDFLVVTDHAEYMGIVAKLFEGDPELTKTKNGKMLSDLVKQGKAQETFFKIAATVNSGTPYEDLNSLEMQKPVWHGTVDAAERHNDPGNFTSFIGWEWSSIPDGANLHRIVFMKENGDVAKKYLPYSAFDSDKPEDLWNFLEKTEKETGAEFVAIPHNGNVSKGRMFAQVDSEGRPLTAQYAKARMRWEPIYEVTQIKGDGETLGVLSPDDEFAEFETYDHAMDAKTGNENSHGLPADKGAYTALPDHALVFVYSAVLILQQVMLMPKTLLLLDTPKAFRWGAI